MCCEVGWAPQSVECHPCPPHVNHSRGGPASRGSSLSPCFLLLQCWSGRTLKFCRPTGPVPVLDASVKPRPAGSAWGPLFILPLGIISPPLLLPHRLPHTAHPAAPLSPAHSWNVPGVSLPSVLPHFLALGTRVASSSCFLGPLSMSAEAWQLHPHLSTCCFCAQTLHGTRECAGFDLEFRWPGYLSVRALHGTLALPRESLKTYIDAKYPDPAQLSPEKDRILKAP